MTTPYIVSFALSHARSSTLTTCEEIKQYVRMVEAEGPNGQSIQLIDITRVPLRLERVISRWRIVFNDKYALNRYKLKKPNHYRLVSDLCGRYPGMMEVINTTPDAKQIDLTGYTDDSQGSPELRYEKLFYALSQ